MNQTNRISAVVDTNVFVSSISSKSPFHAVYLSLIEGHYDLYITQDILLEYEEQIRLRYSPATAEYFMDALHELPNVFKQEIYFNWQLIAADTDDDKFVDCAIAANVDYLVTNDRHFNILKTIDYPKVNVVTLQDFLKIDFEG